MKLASSRYKHSHTQSSQFNQKVAFYLSHISSHVLKEVLLLAYDDIAIILSGDHKDNTPFTSNEHKGRPNVPPGNLQLLFHVINRSDSPNPVDG